MLTVLQIIPSMGRGGAEQTCAPVAAALTARGDKAILVTTGGELCADFEAAGGEVILRDVKTKNPFKIYRNARWLADLIKTRKIDIVHARSRAPAWSALIACKRTDIPFVTTFHAAYKFGGGLKRAYNAVMAKGDRVIAISKYIAQHVRDCYGVRDRLRIIPRGVDVAAFDPGRVSDERQNVLRSLWGVAEGMRVIFAPARLSPIKGQSIAIEAMAALGPTDAVLILAGDPQGREAYRASLAEKIEKLKLQDRVKLVPNCADMAAGYSLASLVLVPSKVPEGFGRVPVEAACMGVPVIARALGATSETVIDGKTGWLVRSEDPAQWAEVMRRALSLSPDAARRMGLAARANALAHFDKDRMIAATLAVYDDVTHEA